jgi:hypothetical protein
MRRRRRPTETSSVRASEGSADRVRASCLGDVFPPRARPPCATHLLVRCAIRYCVRFHTFLYSRKLIVIRAGSTEPHVSVNEHGRRGYCVGFPRTGLLTSTSSLAAASASRNAADPLASLPRRPSALCSSLRDEPLFNRCIAAIARANRAANVPHPLLRLRSGRHALDEAGRSQAMLSSMIRLGHGITVKNLRFVVSAVLLLNFSEVRAFHLCTTSVSM